MPVLLSMTGFGSARGVGSGFTVSVEVRSVNNRHLKLVVRGTDPYPLFEAEIEKLVRLQVRRGSVQVQVHVDRQKAAGEWQLNLAALKAYKQQVIEACDGLDSIAVNAVLSGLLLLPGVAPETVQLGDLPEDEWPVVSQCLQAALGKLDAVRTTEGQAMATVLLELHAALSAELSKIRQHLPGVTAAYRERILERIRLVVAEAGVTVQPEHLIREVAIFSDRTEVAEEVTRFSAHLEQFVELVGATGAEGAGRRLEFMVQELGREANTLGSKAGDVTISRHVVELKATLEKIRELIQNVE